MAQFNDLESHEPAFIKHEKFIRTNRPRGVPKKFHDCCFSLANLALIVAAILGLVFSVKFFRDESLNEYGEYLLQLRFYNQLIFVIVILPLVLLLPIFNAITGFCLMSSKATPRQELGSSVLYVKLVYEILLAALAIVALIFVAPYMRYEGVYSQLDVQLKKFMSLRYQDEFYLQSMDRMQRDYKCCDVPFYRNLFVDQTLPWTCYAADGSTRYPYSRSCSQVLADLISDRCLVLVACLLVILAALAALLALDIGELCRVSSGRHYDVRACESELAAHSDPDESARLAPGLSQSPSSRIEHESGRQTPAESERTSQTAHSDDEDDDDESRREADAKLARQTQSIHDELVEELNSKLKDRAGHQETVRLLPKPASTSQRPSATETRQKSPIPACKLDDLEDWPSISPSKQRPTNAGQSRPAPPILTRVNYLPASSEARPRSPLFLTRADESPIRAEISSTSSQIITKSVLKKSTSITRVDDSDNESDHKNDDYDEEDQMKRDTPTRRSMLNVRFDC